MSTMKERGKPRLLERKGSSQKDRQELALWVRIMFCCNCKIGLYLVFYNPTKKIKTPPQIMKLPVA